MSRHWVGKMTFEFLDDALAHWALETPNATAVRYGGTSFDYRNLNDAADQIAAFVHSKGVSRGDRVAILATKSFDAIAAAFGILRAGAIYVPIDPAAPDARVETVLADCAVSLVLADGVRLEKAPAGYPVAEIAEARNNGLTPVRVERAPSDLSYILYTSGTTGHPKGICHTHKSGMAYAKMAAELCSLHKSDKVSHHTPLHFDMSIFDVFSTIIAGASIIVIPEVYAKLPAALSTLIELEAVTVWYSVPFAISQLVSRGALDSRDLSSLRIVMFAGEAMHPNILAAFAKHTPGAALLNAYGPTETNHCLTARICPGKLTSQEALPIGQPDEGITVAVSPTGELLVSGAQVMQGYWNNADRTENAFCDLPMAGDLTRFYKTGDIVSQNSDNCFELTGRADRQVKLRGYRVELDEIEHVIASCEGVEDVAVAVSDDKETLTAFVAGSASEDTLLEHTSNQLPAYAVPAHFNKLRALARTSTGKLDRRTMVNTYNDSTAA